ncbi:DeoR/GlpR family DNA-binding transcription regulator [Clostridium chauvoei]|uniref:DeoR/GlpR family DNA-binding transcription regulator n=2 Tax=Clostridium chauvoei TaxID=46867 RepID=A0ABD4RDS3_9CLOT|nr:DeoR/GlpR family DNA-binding transcription regulator [Clostridium chauvoei]ATD55044.1 DeoR family transcriptional regulator [Clostridium chauvoei]ATD57282.1 DeoR family transcriptional regulator [Clostridium chauvoei]MBX7279387.1 DeoR/GlpR family DNA-binding transcription regulator [Clostridium chauvoei]MBX7282527.1 DeoR/GlpR family DNA-binding transcription regulator [Clostridium chauvoei]MBX7285585.1 DeoR/GlpR family DNA-binding transcription regulator [Clostridium chauvoei]
MLAIERRQKIVEIIQEEKKVLVQELAINFSVTEETIRRDLEKLEDQGILKRTYGGAIVNEGTNVDMPLDMREVVNKGGKLKIAEKVAEEIKDGETLMLDSSSTAFYVAKCLKKNNKKVTIITNSFKVVTELQDVKDINLILAGGTFRLSSKSFVGKWAENVIKNYYVNKAIICCKGMDINRGVMDSNEQEAEIKKYMAKCSNQVVLVVDKVKFDKSSFVKIMDFKDIDIIYTDEKISEEWESTLKINKVQLTFC